MTAVIERLCVFLGSRDGSDPRFAATAYDVGRELAERGIELVYGAGGARADGRGCPRACSTTAAGSTA